MQANDRFLEDEKQTFRISLYIYLLIFLVVVILASINKYCNGAADKLKLYLLLKLEQIILKAKAIILRRNIGKQLLYKYIDNNGEENYVSDGNDTIHPLNVEGNQINNQNTTQRRITLRRLLRNNPIIASNIETIAQQFGQEAEEGLRIIIENRRAQDVNCIMSRMNITELRSYIPDKYLGTFDEENAQYLRTIVNWYGQTAGILLLRLNNTNHNQLKIDYKNCAESITVCLSTIISKLFPYNSEFDNSIQELKYLENCYNSFPKIMDNLKSSNYSLKELEVVKLVLDSGTYILKKLDSPFYSRYINDHIPVCKKLYKLLHKLNKDSITNGEPKVTSNIKRKIWRALKYLKLSDKHLRNIKAWLFWSESPAAVYKFYKEESKKYMALKIKKKQIYI